MGTIDTIRLRDQPITIGACTYDALDRVSFRIWIGVAVEMILAKLEKRRTRRHLSQLDDAQLADLGITREQAACEIRKSMPLYRRAPRD